MPLLQVRDFPEYYYSLLAQAAEEANRSITQQTIYMLKTQLDNEFNKNQRRRREALAVIDSLNIKIPEAGLDAVQMIREDRENDYR